MDTVKSLEGIYSEEPSVLTIGKFDGLHRGHMELVRRMDGSSLKKIVFSLCISPTTLLTLKEKAAALEDAGVDLDIECPFTPEVITMEPEDFVEEILVRRLKAKKLVVGADFRFGSGRRGSIALLNEMGGRLGFAVEAVEKLQHSGGDISTSRIKAALSEGLVEEANEMLGYRYFITGQVLKGRRIGRTLGFPTVNLVPEKEKFLPKNGVYYSGAFVGNDYFQAVTDIGTKPTVGGGFAGVETHLFGASGDMYGRDQKIELLAFERPEMKFGSLEALKERIALDKENAAKWHAEHGGRLRTEALC